MKNKEVTVSCSHEIGEKKEIIWIFGIPFEFYFEEKERKEGEFIYRAGYRKLDSLVK
jgi:hypothetical protein